MVTLLLQEDALGPPMHGWEQVEVIVVEIVALAVALAVVPPTLLLLPLPGEEVDEEQELQVPYFSARTYLRGS